MSTSLTARRRSFVAVQLTLTTSGTVYNVLDEINKIIAAESNMPVPPMVCVDACAQLSFQNAVGNTSNVLLGDSLISTTRFGINLPLATSTVNSDPVLFHSNMNNISVGGWYALASADGQKLNVMVMAA